MSLIMNQATSVIPIGGVATLTGNSGGAVGPSLGNINIVGSGDITVTGNPGTSTLTISGGADQDYTIVSTSTTPYVALSTDQVIAMNSTGGSKTVQLPNAPITGKWYIVKDSAGTAVANNITVTTVGGVVLIDAAATFVMNSAYESGTFVFDGTKYLII